MDILRIATRQSPLALWQAEFVKAKILTIYPNMHIELVSFVTEGDKKLDQNLAKIGGKGLFTKELESALLCKKVDIAIHSVKDMTVKIANRLILGAVCQRDDPRDALICSASLYPSDLKKPDRPRPHETSQHSQTYVRMANGDKHNPRISKMMGINVTQLADLPHGAVIGTSSSRRASLLQEIRPDLSVKMLRGNVGTRLKKLDDGEYDAIILAAAGLHRLGRSHRINAYLPPETWIPAVGQGAIGVECHIDHSPLLASLLSALDHTPTRRCIIAERHFNAALNGGCELPIAAYAVEVNGELQMRSFMAHPEKPLFFRAELNGSADDPAALGEKLAALLKSKMDY